jgi:hypothetical protein
LIGPLYDNILEDINWAKSKAEKVKENMEKGQSLSSPPPLGVDRFSDIEYVVIFSPCSRGTGSSKAQSSQSVDITGDSSMLFDNFEDEIFCQESVATVYFRPSNAGSSQNSGIAAALLPVSSLSTCIREIKKMIASS